jgi:hypothetical protein
LANVALNLLRGNFRTKRRRRNETKQNKKMTEKIEVYGKRMLMTT